MTRIEELEKEREDLVKGLEQQKQAAYRIEGAILLLNAQIAREKENAKPKQKGKN